MIVLQSILILIARIRNLEDGSLYEDEVTSLMYGNCSNGDLLFSFKLFTFSGDAPSPQHLLEQQTAQTLGNFTREYSPTEVLSALSPLSKIDRCASAERAVARNTISPVSRAKMAPEGWLLVTKQRSLQKQHRCFETGYSQA